MSATDTKETFAFPESIRSNTNFNNQLKPQNSKVKALADTRHVGIMVFVVVKTPTAVIQAHELVA